MNQLNKYVLTSFLRPFVFSYASLSVLVLMAELMEKLDKFMAGKASVTVVIHYTLALWPVRSMQLIPVAALLAVLFSLGQLSRRLEITAAMAGGVHPWRLVSPLIFCGLVLSFFSWGLGESVTPWANRVVHKLWTTDIRRTATPRATRFENVTATAPGILYAVGLLDVEKGEIQNVVMDLSENDFPTAQWQARSGFWTEQGWVLKNGVERRYDTQQNLVGQTFFTEKQTHRLESPKDLAPHEPDTESMNSQEIKQNVEKLKILGNPNRRMEVEGHMKRAMPWANLIIVLLGIPFAFNKRSGKVKSVAVALAVAFAYFSLLQAGRALGQKPWCPPFLGAWLANLVFLAVASRQLWKMRSI